MPIYFDGLKYIKKFYRWNGDNKPEIPTINKDTGKIIDWKD
ncbi:hypothetical protein [Spiroplasma endosymbiont of Polydrusus formosus]